MKVQKNKRKKILSGLDDVPEVESTSVDEAEALEKATDSVIAELPDRKRKKYERANWGDRPENLRKPLSQMSADEKAEYYRWKAGDIKQIEEKPVAYDEGEVYALGCFILPMLCARMPNPQPPTSDELQGFSRVMTPLANKYFSQMQYKEEINAGLFALAFIIPRLQGQPVSMNAEYSG